MPFDRLELRRPQGAVKLEPGRGVAERAWLESEHVRPAGDGSPADAGLLEHPQALRDRGLGDTEPAGRVPDRGRAGGQALDDLAADRVGESSERIVNQTVNDISRDADA